MKVTYKHFYLFQNVEMEKYVGLYLQNMPLSINYTIGLYKSDQNKSRMDGYFKITQGFLIRIKIKVACIKIIKET